MFIATAINIVVSKIWSDQKMKNIIHASEPRRMPSRPRSNAPRTQRITIGRRRPHPTLSLKKERGR
jgi:hypothetical protein